MRPIQVSIVIPCYNEAGTIGGLLAAIYSQDYPKEDMEVLIADGGSTDESLRVIQEFAAKHPALGLTVIPNPTRSIPSGLNRAIAEAKGETLIRLDAHSIPAPDYVERCLSTLSKTDAANAGGAWTIRPSRATWMAHSIAVAAGHPLGAGDARYRTGGLAGPVDTVPFGAFPMVWLRRVGGYEEALEANEDYDLNYRLRELGGLVWFDPMIRSIYYARADLLSLARQYYRYGYWKARMLIRHPGALRWRQAVAPVFLLSTILLGGLAIPFQGARLALLIQSSAYVLALGGAAIQKAIAHRAASMAVGIPLAWSVMHFAWGTGFWLGLVSSPPRGSPGKRRGTP